MRTRRYIRKRSLVRREGREAHPQPYQCRRCSNGWTPRGFAKPVICPKCKSRDWWR